MATVSTIGTSGRNYSTIAAWDAAFANGGWEGQCYNDSEFFEQVNLGGTSSVNYEYLHCAAGQSAFNNSANPLTYDVSKGVGLTYDANYSYTMRINAYCTVRGLQIEHTGTGGNNVCIRADFNGDEVFIDKCLCLNTAQDINSFSAGIYLFGNGVQWVTNSVIIVYKARGIKLDYASDIAVINCTIVAPSDKANTTSAFAVSSGTCWIQNVAGFGFSAFSTSSTPAGNHNATDAASIGFTSANSLTSLTYANQFESVSGTTLNFRLKTGSSLKDAGADTSSDDVTVDIFGTSRPQGSAYDIGAHEPVFVPAGYTLTANAGTFAVAGAAATLRAARKLTAAVGSISVTGAAATLRRMRRLIAAAGAFTVTGANAALRLARKLTAAAGAFTVAGAVVTLRVARKLAAAVGSFAVTGFDAVLDIATTGYRLIAGAGNFAVAGAVASLRAARKLTAAGGSFTVTGGAAVLKAARRFAADAASFAVTGANAALKYARILIAAAGSFAVTGTTVTFFRGRILIAEAGALIVTGLAAVLRRVAILRGDTGAFSVAGHGAEFPIERPFRWEPVAENPESWASQSADDTFWTERGPGASPWSQV